MTDVLHVTKRNQLGSAACRRIRRSGSIPAVLYGHGLENVNLSIPEGEVTAAIRHGSRLVEIQGDVSDSALLRDVQWDAMGLEVVHLDLARVSAEEAVEVEVTVDLRGEAPGTKEGGIVEHVTHRLSIRCPAGAIPEHLEVNINNLQLGQSVLASQVALPASAELLSEPELVVVHCVQPVIRAEVEAVPTEAAEPEVIGRAAEREEGEAEA
jgi:large subunit ribosomal protein L25